MIKSILYLCKYRFQLALKGVLSLIIASFIRQTEITNQSNSHINIPFILCPFCDTWMSTHNIQRSTQCEKKVKKQIYSEPTLPGSKPAQLPLRGAITGARNHLSTMLWYFKCSRFLIIILSIQWQIRWNQNRSILNLPWKNRIGEDRGIFVFRRSSKHFVFLKYLFTYEIKNYILYVIRIFLKHHISENHLNQIIL